MKNVILFIAMVIVSNSEARMYDIAKSALEQNITKLKQGSFLSAGSHQFKSFWTRDFCFASVGLLEINRGDVVRNHLEYLLTHRRKDNLVPLYVDSMNPVNRVIAGTVFNAVRLDTGLPVTEDIKAFYLVNGKFEAIDSNLMVLYASLAYYNYTKDMDWFNKHRADFKLIFDFYKSKINDGLILQPEHADWQDSAKRKGKTFFTNLLYYHMGKQYSFLNEAELHTLRDKLVEVFYDRKAGLFKSIAGRNLISLDGNLWAIDHNLIADKDKLYQNLTNHPLFRQFSMPGYATYPSYSGDDQYIQVKVVGLTEYHGNLFWSWLMAYSAKVAFKENDQARFQNYYAQLERVLNRDRTVYEIYRNDDDKTPMQTLLYKSESPFSWGAGFVLDLEGTVRRGH